MLNQESPIIDFYPTHFETDLNGKVQEWEAVVLIPFIDEVRMACGTLLTFPYVSHSEMISRLLNKQIDRQSGRKKEDRHPMLCSISDMLFVVAQSRLLAAMAPLEVLLLAEEKERNKPGHCLNYRFNPALNFKYKSTHRSFPDITTCRTE